jgi:hypothetical protein
MKQFSEEEIRERLIAAGVKNLKEFGYSEVTNENILTDEVYGEFFNSMLRDNKGHSTRIDKVIDELLNR